MDLKTLLMKSRVANPAEWLFILRLVPDQETRVKASIKHPLTEKETDFQRLCLKGKCN